MAGNRLRLLCRRFFKRRDLERELNEELASHVAMETARRVRDGESPGIARLAALREFGNMRMVAEVTRRQWGLAGLEQALRDARYTLRSFARTPLFSGIVMLTLALGIGSSTTIFSLLDGILLARSVRSLIPIGCIMLWEVPPETHKRTSCEPHQFRRMERAQPFFPVHGGIHEPCR